MGHDGKLQGLEALVQDEHVGFKTLPFEEIDHSYFDLVEKQRLAAEILSLLTKSPHVATRLPNDFDLIVESLTQKYSGKKIILRSNSLAEDGKNSFAGIYDSVVVENVTPDSIRTGLRRVYDSFYSNRALKYRNEHGIENDKMGIIIQEFIEPDFAGVIYTSNPTFPNDLSLEFNRGRNKVVDATTQPYIIDFDKRKGIPIFQSENWYELPDKRSVDLNELLRIGTELENRHGALDIEFLIKSGEVYLVQRRPITDLSQPVEVKIPRYGKKSLIGSSKVNRGHGAVTLPVLKPRDYRNLLHQAEVLSSLGEGQATFDLYRDWLNYIVNMDKRYKEGYILVIPEFNERQLAPGVPGIRYETTMDFMTPNKKAVITTNWASISSHIMTIARERGIGYAGFENGAELFENVATGDVLSIYFKGREAAIYREKASQKTIRELHPDLQFIVTKESSTKVRIRSSAYISSDTPYADDFDKFLKDTKKLGHWKQKQRGESMDWTFTNRYGRNILMSMMAMVGKYHEWVLDVGEGCKAFRYKPLPKAEFSKLMEGYERHLGK